MRSLSSVFSGGPRCKLCPLTAQTGKNICTICELEIIFGVKQAQAAIAAAKPSPCPVCGMVRTGAQLGECESLLKAELNHHV